MTHDELKGMHINEELFKKFDVKYEQLEGRLVLDCDSYNVVCSKNSFPEFKLVFGIVEGDMFLTSRAIYPVSLTIKLDKELIKRCNDISFNQIIQYEISKIVKN